PARLSPTAANGSPAAADRPPTDAVCRQAPLVALRAVPERPRRPADGREVAVGEVAAAARSSARPAVLAGPCLDSTPEVLRLFRSPRPVPDTHLPQLHARVVVGEDLPVGVASLGHAVGSHLAHADAVAEAPAGEEPAGLLVLGGQTLGGEEGVRHVEGPAHGEAVHLHGLPLVVVDPDLAYAPRFPALQHVEAAELEAREAGVHLRRELGVGTETGPRAVGAAAVEGDAVEVQLLVEGHETGALPEEG